MQWAGNSFHAKSGARGQGKYRRPQSAYAGKGMTKGYGKGWETWAQPPVYYQPPQKETAWWCHSCEAPHHQVYKAECRICATPRPNPPQDPRHEAPTTPTTKRAIGKGPGEGTAQRTGADGAKGKGKSKGKPTAVQQNAKDEEKSQKGGLAQHQLDLIAKIEQKIQMDEAGFPQLAPKQLTPLPPEKEAEVRRHRATLAGLRSQLEEDQDQELIALTEKKLNAVTGKQTTAAGEEREGAQLHQAMGALKRYHAPHMEQRNKEVQESKEALEKAATQLREAQEARTEAAQAFEKLKMRIAGLLDRYEDDHTQGAATVPTLDPVAMQPILRRMVNKVKVAHNVGDTAEIQAVNKFCSLFLADMQEEMIRAAAEATMTPLPDQEEEN